MPMDIEPAREELARRLPWRPEVFLVLGSGLGGLSEAVDDPVPIRFEELPGLPAASVAGHGGRFVAGRLEGKRVLMQAGRFHYYEGHPDGVIVAPMRLAASLGAGVAVLTNAAGGIRRTFRPGDLMLLDDHLNLQWRAPLAGPVREGEERFPDMSSPYDRALGRLAMEHAADLGIVLHRGVYAAVPGPSYETPAEVRALALMGADAVGMSTVPEVIAARASGLRVLAISVITNPAAGIAAGPLSHDEVLEAGRVAAGDLERLVRSVLAHLPAMPEGGPTAPRPLRSG